MPLHDVRSAAHRPAQGWESTNELSPSAKPVTRQSILSQDSTSTVSKPRWYLLGGLAALVACCNLILRKSRHPRQQQWSIVPMMADDDDFESPPFLFGQRRPLEVRAVPPMIAAQPRTIPSTILPWLAMLLGRDVAESAAKACPEILQTPRTVLEESLRILARWMGPDRALSAVSRCPSLLVKPSLDLSMNIQQWVAILGLEGAVQKATEDPSILLISAADQRETRRLLLNLVGLDVAARLWYSNPRILAVAPQVLQASHQVLMSLFGVHRTAEIIMNIPSLLTTSPAYMEEIIDELKAKCGDEIALAIINEWPAVLLQSPSALHSRLKDMEQRLGPNAVAPILTQVPALLSKPVGQLAEVLTLLSDALGAEAAKTISLANPTVLVGSPEALNLSLQLLADYFSPQKVAAVVGRWPESLTIPPKALQDALPPLLETIGDPLIIANFLADLETMPTGASIREVLMLLVEVFGPTGAQDVVKRDPSILTCSSLAMRASMNVLARGLGRVGAYNAALQHLSLMKTPAPNMEANMQALGALLGPQQAAVAVANAPLLLAEPIYQCFATLGPETLQQLVLLHPLLLRTEGAEGWRVVEKLLIVLGPQAAVDCLRRSPKVFFSPNFAVDGLEPILQAMRWTLPPEEAIQIIEAHPQLLAASPAEVRSSLAALVDSIGLNTTLKALRACPDLLVTPADTIRGVMLILASKMGQSAAVKKVESDYRLLQQAPDPKDLAEVAAMTDAGKTLIDILGQTRAMEAMVEIPELLTSPITALRAASRELYDLLGEESARRTLSNNPRLLLDPSPRFAESLQVLIDVLGQNPALSLVEDHSQLLTLPVEELSATAAMWASLLGRRGAAKVLCKYPDRLTLPRSRMMSVLSALVSALGPADATELLLMHEELPLHRPADMPAVMRGLVQTLGKEAAQLLVATVPAVLWEAPLSLQTRFQQLARLLGKDGTWELIRSEPQSILMEVDDIMAGLAPVVRTFGAGNLPSILKRNRGLLEVPTLERAVQQLVQELGPALALKAAQEIKNLLKWDPTDKKAVAIREALAILGRTFSPDDALTLLRRLPVEPRSQPLSEKALTMQRTVYVLREVFPMDTAIQLTERDGRWAAAAAEQAESLKAGLRRLATILGRKATVRVLSGDLPAEFDPKHIPVVTEMLTLIFPAEVVAKILEPAPWVVGLDPGQLQNGLLAQTALESIIEPDDVEQLVALFPNFPAPLFVFKMKVMVDIFGPEDAVNAIMQQRAIITESTQPTWEDFHDLISELALIFGNDGALRVLRRHPPILQSSASVVRPAFQVLTDLFGLATAIGAADCNPQFLLAEAGAMRDGFLRLGALLGDEWLRATVLTPRAPTFDATAVIFSVTALVDLLGMDRTLSALRDDPDLAGLPDTQIKQAMAAIVKEFGAEEAQRRVNGDPSLLKWAAAVVTPKPTTEARAPDAAGEAKLPSSGEGSMPTTE